MNCPNCQRPEFVETTTPYKTEVAGHKYLSTVRALKCGHCGEVLLDGEAAVRAELEVAQHIAMHGPVSGEGFRFMRIVLGKQAQELAPLLDRRPEALSRWERGHGTIDRAAWGLVGLLVLDQARGREDSLALLRTLSRAKKVPATVRLDRAAKS